MRLLGVEKIEDLGPKHVSDDLTMLLPCILIYFQINSRMVERDIYDGPAGFEKFGLWVKARL